MFKVSNINRKPPKTVMMMRKQTINNYTILFGLLIAATCSLFVALLLPNQHKLVSAQGIKGGGGGGFFSSNQQISSANQPVFGGGGSSSSSSFVQMFNQLTPIQQKQFISQMSSSNKRIFQAIQPSFGNSAFSEEVSSSSGGQTIPTASFGGTKSSNFKSSSQVLSPVQQAFFRSQQTQQQTSQPIIQPSSQFSFSRQVSSQVQQPTFIPQSKESNSFQSSRTVVSSAQPQQSSYFNRVQQVQQVAQPVVLPSSEQSFRRVQSFSSQPIQLPETSSGFSQQIFRQQQVAQPVPVSSSFNKFQQSQFSSGVQPVGGSSFNSEFSNSTSSSLGGNGGFSSSLDASGFGAALQQEKVDANSLGGFNSFDGSSNIGLNGAIGGQSGFNNQNSQFSSSNGGFGLPTIGGSNNRFESSSSSTGSGFESADVQQKNVAGGIPEDFYGITAASINNKWYIMKPVENPNALGLGDASSGTTANLRQVPITREQLNKVARLQAAPKSGISSSALSSSTSAGKSPKKKRANSGSAESEGDQVAENKKRSAAAAAASATAEAARKPTNDASSSETSNDEEEEERKR